MPRSAHHHSPIHAPLLRLFITVLTCSVSLLGLAVPGSSSGVPALYTVEKLPLSEAYGINERSQVVGVYFSEDYWGACVWQGGVITELDGAQWGYTAAVDINNRGEVGGHGQVQGGGAALRPLLWKNGHATQLPLLSDPPAEVNALNDNGQVVGWALVDFQRHACVWNGGVRDLGTLGGLRSEAKDINSSGKIVGWVEGPQLGTRACVWHGASTTTLGDVGDVDSWANAINELDQVVGAVIRADSADGAVRACLWEDDGVTDLGAPGERSWAVDINDVGQVVGTYEDEHVREFAFLWDTGRVFDLNALIPAGSGWVLERAVAINNRGEILGVGSYGNETEVPFLLRPPCITPNEPAFPAPSKLISDFGPRVPGQGSQFHRGADYRFQTPGTDLTPFEAGHITAIRGDWSGYGWVVSIQGATTGARWDYCHTFTSANPPNALGRFELRQEAGTGRYYIIRYEDGNRDPAEIEAVYVAAPPGVTPPPIAGMPVLPESCVALNEPFAPSGNSRRREGSTTDTAQPHLHVSVDGTGRAALAPSLLDNPLAWIDHPASHFKINRVSPADGATVAQDLPLTLSFDVDSRIGLDLDTVRVYIDETEIRPDNKEKIPPPAFGYGGLPGQFPTPSISGSQTATVGGSRAVFGVVGVPLANDPEIPDPEPGLDRFTISGLIVTGLRADKEHTLKITAQAVGRFQGTSSTPTPGAPFTHESKFKVKPGTRLGVTAQSGIVGETRDLTATLVAVTGGAALADQTVTFLVGSVEIGSAVTNPLGVATLPYKIGSVFGKGIKELVARYGGSETYAASSGKGQLTIYPAPTSLTVTNAAGTIGQSVDLTATLRRETDSSAMEGKKVTFRAGSLVAGSATTNAAGEAVLAYVLPASLGAGTRTLSASYAGEPVYLASSGAGTLTVGKADVTVAVTNRTARRGTTVSLTATLQRTDGTAVPGKSLAFVVQGRGVGSAVTNSSGVATLSYAIPATTTAGAKTLTARFNGDAAHNAGVGTGVLTVDP